MLTTLQSSSQNNTPSVFPHNISLQESFCLNQRREEQVESRLRVKVRKKKLLFYKTDTLSLFSLALPTFHRTVQYYSFLLIIHPSLYLLR